LAREIDRSRRAIAVARELIALADEVRRRRHRQAGPDASRDPPPDESEY
jgi:hypothetical protein